MVGVMSKSAVKTGLGEGLLGGGRAEGQEGDPAVEWAAYLEGLKETDPDEYALLMKDIEQFVETKKQTEKIVTRPEEGLADSEAPDFSPRLPGGKVMGKGGVKEQEEEEGERVVPVPGFVLKTRTSTGDKVFVNICQSPLIQKMSTKKTLADDGSEQEGINIPLSLGPPKTDVDKSGGVCVVYDIIVNPEVISNANDDKTGSSRSFLCELALQYIEQKYNCQVDYKYKLSRLVYKGDKDRIPYQLIRKRRAPVIEEVSDEGANPARAVLKPTAAAASKPKRRPPQPLAYSLSIRSADGSIRSCEAVLKDPVQARPEEDETLLGSALLFRAQLDRVKTEPELAAKLKVQASAEVLSLRCEGFYQPLDLFMPCTVDEGSAQASFDSAESILTVELAVLPSAREAWRASHEPDPGSRPWLLANALHYSEGGESASSEQLGPVGLSEDSSSRATQPKIPSDDDILPEDRFHTADMLSQHIKDERERERSEKIKRHEEESAAKAEEERKLAEAERLKSIEAVLAEAERALALESARTGEAPVDRALAFEDEDDLEDLLI